MASIKKMSLSPNTALTGVQQGVETNPSGDISSFFESMEDKVGRSLGHQPSMIEVPKGLSEFKQLGDDDDHSQADHSNISNNTIEINDSDSEYTSSINEDNDDNDVKNDPAMQRAIGKEHDLTIWSDDENEDDLGSRDRASCKTELELTNEMSGSVPDAFVRLPSTALTSQTSAESPQVVEDPQQQATKPILNDDLEENDAKEMGDDRDDIQNNMNVNRGRNAFNKLDDDHKRRSTKMRIADDLDDLNTFKASGIEKEDSLTMMLDADRWLVPKEGDFEECDLRFDEDEMDGKKPPASDFRNLKLFFHFFYERFYSQGSLFLETSLPLYQEWKKRRKAYRKFGSNSHIKKIDHCLKACHESTHALRAMCYNCVLLCYDKMQSFEVHYAGCQAPLIPPCKFEVGQYSIISCWDLFELGASPSHDDWRRALSNDCVAQVLCHAQPDLRHFPKDQRKAQYSYQMIKKYQLYCLAEHMKKFGIKSCGFGTALEWKKIKAGFVKKCDRDVLNAGDAYTYYLNPKVDVLAAILQETADMSKVATKRKIICEPLMWLIYVGYYLLDRQHKLQELVLSTYQYQDTKVKGQKLQTMITKLAKDAKDESERLRKVMAKLPSQEDLQTTLENEITERDPKLKNQYTKSFDKAFVVSTNKSMTDIVKGKR